MASAQDRDRRFRRAEQHDLVVPRLPAERSHANAVPFRQAMGGARQSSRVGFGRAAVLGRDDDRRQAPERRQAAPPALLGLLRVEPLGVA